MKGWSCGFHSPRACFVRCFASGSIIFVSASCTPLGEPGRQNMIVLFFVMPAVARLSIVAVPISSLLSCLNSSPNPGISFLNSGFVASIVLSWGVMPVPPLISIRSGFMLAFSIFSILFVIFSVSSGRRV